MGMSKEQKKVWVKLLEYIKNNNTSKYIDKSKIVQKINELKKEEDET